MTDDPILITGAARTPMGGFQGELSGLSAPQLGGVAIRAALNGLAEVDEVIMGCVLPAGLGQAPARQAGLAAGLPVSVPATTVNKMCGSGMKAVMLGFDAIVAGSADRVIAGGMESMSNAPYLLPKARVGLRMGHGEVKDSMFLDGLEDAYQPGRLMGSFADESARRFGLSRQVQDDYALASLERALAASASGWFDAELVPVETKAGQVARDEQPRKARPEKIPLLKPAFSKDGTVTAANASSISDGAAAVLLTRGSAIKGMTPLARLIAHASHAEQPYDFCQAPIGAIEKLLRKVGWRAKDVDLYEINEAFAVVPLIAMQTLGLPHDRVNIHGGACALGHPIGASGARILVTLIHALKRLGKTRGVAAICIGGGEATAVAIEAV